MEEPTLEQIKEHFKNVKTVRSLADKNIFCIDIETIHGTNSAYWCYSVSDLNKGDDVMLFNRDTNEYAAMIENKTSTPTLEQVKEHFKDAKKVKCLLDRSTYTLDIETIYEERYSYWCSGVSDLHKSLGVLLFDKETNKLAEITEYKTPTLEQVKEHFKNAKTVKCLYDDNIFSINSNYIYRASNGNFGCRPTEDTCSMVFNTRTKKYAEIIEYKEEVKDIEVIAEEVAPYYDNSNGSLYKISKQRKWNAYQFDIIKRIDRCLKKGEFEKDLKKTKVLIDLFLKENNE